MSGAATAINGALPDVGSISVDQVTNLADNIASASDELVFEADIRFVGLADDAGPTDLALVGTLEIQRDLPSGSAGEWITADTSTVSFEVAADASLQYTTVSIPGPFEDLQGYDTVGAQFVISHSATHLDQPAWDPLNITFSYNSGFYTNLTVTSLEGDFAETANCSMHQLEPTAGYFIVRLYDCDEPFKDGDTITANIDLVIRPTNEPD